MKVICNQLLVPEDEVTCAFAKRSREFKAEYCSHSTTAQEQSADVFDRCTGHDEHAARYIEATPAVMTAIKLIYRRK